MAISETKLQSILQNSFPNAKIKITDTAGDQDHYALEITSNVFKDLPLIKQHRLVKEALAEVLVKELHAISIKTKAEN
ncbi:BolA family transcriptional regulator [Candidatus Megaera venefica]|jgi:stress-induced morphogen|uniref:BolA family transcriptional regulator n=1 Tax=Candidatus Megaera venefica TaxID=2055910 RepID=A0ABU5NCA7_9RICK|nr:BolA/IbaG family iron-sulfur metabolism protein [Candidatus Megaera venefica]MBY0534002.1 BolA/IbaG family iron-sulfur metabolism protein [Rickettsiaceae bacterium]MEA0970816.1 BolA family transcriptional regulator [Candidatus Megaera venefica]